MRTGRRLLREIELDPIGFVAPGYAYTRALRDELGDTFEWFADLRGIHLRSGADVRSPALCLGSSTTFKRALSPAVRAAASRAAGPVMRIDVHPADFDLPGHVATLEALLERAAGRRRRSPTTSFLGTAAATSDARASVRARGGARPARQLARGPPPQRRRPVRVHVPGDAALPPPVVLGLVLPRDRLAPLRPPRARARSCERWSAPAGSTGSSPTPRSGTGRRTGAGRRSTAPTPCSAARRPRRSRRRCWRSPGSWWRRPRPTPEFVAEGLPQLRLHYDWLQRASATPTATAC